ncbi:glycosyltransferase [Glaciihabitans sp. dw_435]|uniref:glycosyltransferase n=1 Tax=Glaciihabitans sp. dw_435 TaxID=2720081 RepID=UPI001BD461E8|nr:glycosyltransferase [Glaciihabitans sp. dw_435]
MSSEIDHVILTRFNLPSAGVESFVRAQEGWLRTRIVLFETYCLPSVRAQTNQNFTWLIYFDPESPDWLMERIALHAAAGAFVPKFRTSVDAEELLSDLREVSGQKGRLLLTTNLDNDDGLAVDFVDRLQSVPSTPDRTALYIGDGLISSPDAVYRRLDRHNAFCSVRETWDEPMTCWVDWHDLLPTRMPVTVVRGNPGWLQVIHGTNVSNRVRGSRVAPAVYARLFPGLLDGIVAPSSAGILRDRFVEAPLRTARDGVRIAAKRSVRAVLGRDGLDRLKSRLAVARSRLTRSRAAAPRSSP